MTDDTYRLLVVDDEAHMPRILALKLEPEGWRVDIARNGAEALRRLSESPPPHALITDLVMPVMDGKALCQEIEARYPDRLFPIFIISSSTERDVREWSKTMKNIDFLEKPVSPKKVLAMLGRVLVDNQSDNNGSA